MGCIGQKWHEAVVRGYGGNSPSVLLLWAGSWRDYPNISEFPPVNPGNFDAWLWDRPDFLTIEQWARILPGVCGLAGLNALSAFWSGHQVNRPFVPMPPAIALTH